MEDEVKEEVVNETVPQDHRRLDREVAKKGKVSEEGVTVEDLKRLNRVDEPGVVVKGKGDGTVEFLSPKHPDVAIGLPRKRIIKFRPKHAPETTKSR